MCLLSFTLQLLSKALFQALERMSSDKMAVMHLTEEYLQLIIKPVGDETQVFAKLNAVGLITSFVVIYLPCSRAS